MPIYEYECPACGVFEVMQGINDKPLTSCPTCRRRKIRKLISESCFHLKGSGWYVTDYGKGNGGNGNGNGKKNGTSESAGECASTDAPAKPESAPQEKSESGPAKKAAGASTSK